MLLGASSAGWKVGASIGAAASGSVVVEIAAAEADCSWTRCASSAIAAARACCTAALALRAGGSRRSLQPLARQQTTIPNKRSDRMVPSSIVIV